MGALATETDLATFGPVHLEVTDLQRSVAFWTQLIGLEVFAYDGQTAELGAGETPLIVLDAVATEPVRRGHSGLFHLAIHLPSEPEFARVLGRLLAARYPISPTEHIVSKAIYLDDPDGIGVELTLETVERWGVSRFTATSIEVEDIDGNVYSGRDPLDIVTLMATLPDRDFTRPLPDGTFIGHMHLTIGELAPGVEFYRDDLGFPIHTHSDRFGAADFSAAGPFPHRLGVNTFQGVGASQAPAGTARMRHYTIRFDSSERLEAVVEKLGDRIETDEDGHWTTDPSGNRIHLVV